MLLRLCLMKDHDLVARYETSPWGNWGADRFVTNGPSFPSWTPCSLCQCLFLSVPLPSSPGALLLIFSPPLLHPFQWKRFDKFIHPNLSLTRTGFTFQCKIESLGPKSNLGWAEALFGRKEHFLSCRNEMVFGVINPWKLSAVLKRSHDIGMEATSKREEKNKHFMEALACWTWLTTADKSKSWLPQRGKGCCLATRLKNESRGFSTLN